jgi:hypothetical protein
MIMFTIIIIVIIIIRITQYFHNFEITTVPFLHGNKKNSVGLSPRANYTHQATAACRQS